MNPIILTFLTPVALIIFLSLVLNRIQQPNWSWFSVFVPLMAIQAAYLVDAIVMIVRKRGNGSAHRIHLAKLVMFALCAVLLFVFEIMLCLKLEYLPALKMTYICIPIWVVLAVLIVFVGDKLAANEDQGEDEEVRF